ncbi:hypothetical protein B0J17DRAFT_633947 [Rhizoctonia solani]|nr:hypothetical protein B0J17DRAFT_633947 [Rhizoctonia solani]
MTVWAAPVGAYQTLAARGGICLVGCTVGIDTVAILTGLRNDLHPKLKALDDCYTDNTDPTAVINDITDLFNNAGFRIRDLPVDMTGLLNGKGSDIVNAWTSIPTNMVQHFDKWHHKGNLNSQGIGDIFAGLSAQLGGAVSALQGALTGALSGLQSLFSEL